MSYILDALRRADQQRQRHTAPTLLTLQPSAVVRKRPAYLAYAFLAAVLVGAGLVIGWLRPWQTQQPVAVNTQSVAVKPAASAPANPTPLEPAAAPSAIASTSTPESKPADAPSHEANTIAGKSPATAPGRLAYTPAGDAAAEQPVVALADLPQSVRQELPPMTISVHAWSSAPASSMIGINYKILREGDQVAPGLMLDQITPEGAVFTYKGYRFSRGLK